MKSLFRKLFGVDIRHNYYQDGKSKRDFSVLPAINTELDLRALGLTLKSRDDGFNIYAEVELDNSNYLLKRPFSKHSYKFSFYLKQQNPEFFSMTELEKYQISDHLFYFSNLYDSGDSKLALGDQICRSEHCDPIKLVTKNYFHYKLVTPSDSVTVKIKNLFGTNIYSKMFYAQDATEQLTEVMLDFADSSGMLPGRYAIEDSNGHGMDIYYDPQLFGERLFGVIEVFADTLLLTGDGFDFVPEEYKFLQDDVLSDIANYQVRFNTRATLWRYAISKRYTSNNYTIGSLSIAGAVSFNKDLVDDKAIFLSTAQVDLQEKPMSLKLKSGSLEVLDLPIPDRHTRLTVNSDTGGYESTILVYI